MRIGVSACRLRSSAPPGVPPPRPGSVEQHGARVLVVHLLHVPQHVLLGDHAQQPPADVHHANNLVYTHQASTNMFNVYYLPIVRDERLSQTELAEHIDDSLHGRLVGDGDGRHVEDAVEHEAGRRRQLLVRRTRKYHHSLPRDALHRAPSVSCATEHRCYCQLLDFI